MSKALRRSIKRTWCFDFELYTISLRPVVGEISLCELPPASSIAITFGGSQLENGGNPQIQIFSKF